MLVIVNHNETLQKFTKKSCHTCSTSSLKRYDSATVSYTFNNKKHVSVVSNSYYELIPQVMLMEQAGPSITNQYL